MKTAIALGVLFLTVLLGGLYYVGPQSSAYSNTQAVATTTAVSATTTDSSSTTTSGGITATEVAAHGSRQSCWTVINGSVYDLTSWVGQHPGGAAAILFLCGKDGSAAFNAMHGRDPRAQNILASFKIGSFAS